MKVNRYCMHRYLRISCPLLRMHALELRPGLQAPGRVRTAKATLLSQVPEMQGDVLSSE